MTKGAQVATHRLAWSIIVLFVVTLGIGLANLLFTSGQVHNLQRTNTRLDGQVQSLQRTNVRLEQQLHADCGWYGHIAGLPVPFAPGAQKPSELSVRLISDSRVAWNGHGCPGTIPVPDPSLVKWAAYYHLPLG